MVKTTTHAWTFGGVTYGVEGIPVTEKGGLACLGVSTLELAKAEVAIMLAALTDGCRDPEALRFARRCTAYDQTGWAMVVDASQLDVDAWERGRAQAPEACVARIIDLLTQRDRGGFVARRVTV